MRPSGPEAIEFLHALKVCKTVLGEKWVVVVSSRCVLLTLRLNLWAVQSVVCTPVFETCWLKKVPIWYLSVSWLWLKVIG